MRTVYLGTSDFAAGVLSALADGEHRPALVVTPPDQPRGRGRRVASPPAADLARELGIELLQAASVNAPETRGRIAAAEPEVGVVCAFGQLIGAELLGQLELLNVHPSLLPRWRGAAPIERALIAGDERTGVTIMRVTEGLDSGPIALAEELEISAEDDYGTLSARLIEVAGPLLVRALELRAAGGLELTDQDDSRATYAEKISPEERRLDITRPAPELERVVRALTPHIGAYLELEGGEPLGVLRAVAEPGELVTGRLETGDGLRLGCGEGVLRLLVVRPAAGRAMDAADYLRGHPAPRLA